MQHDTLQQWLDWLEHQHPKLIDLGLERVSAVAERLGLISPTATVVTVAGTNGKGSFVHSLGALLKASGQRAGLFTSPHLLAFNERILVDGQQASDNTIMLAFDAIFQASQQLDISLSYFEYSTLAAFYVFNQDNLDFWVLEVGLGGRLDAVNILTPDYAVITSIGLDHMEYLGDTREKIAFEKCGILREQTPFICLEPDAPDVLSAAFSSHHSLVIERDFEVVESSDTVTLTDRIRQCQIVVPQTGLSPASVSGALMLATHWLDIELGDDTAISAALASHQLAARFQRFAVDGIEVVADVAHNPQSAELLHQRLSQLPLKDGAKRIAVFTMLNDKDMNAVIDCLKDDFKAWFTAELDNPRARLASDVANAIHNRGIHMISVSKNLRQAFARARSLCQPDDQIVIFGSFFVVAELLPKLLPYAKLPSIE
ncbi:Dihydrofolate synthase/folylpolyglutamate synthase [BD1-7 clade bacterium]|uniref:Dihydrofolate synthase/folylpolyglutamate synthase n=1 Tax=BD1-7 clade bacterium TaxID=2029982 RepID=A0A5S9NTA1_9GAMM|nr:Dihydrofolate synthase/folylpolyglutamate synthase [BD1-7 clade bacterium]CAA0093836.1 Dihydrofolate synthase/folylpolyglutamate synthase [BD1-7 clade bacterium]